MSSIFVLPRHALSTGFSRLFGASVGLFVTIKVKCYILIEVINFFTLPYFEVW